MPPQAATRSSHLKDVSNVTRGAMCYRGGSDRHIRVGGFTLVATTATDLILLLSNKERA
jgi:hypothetical protein